jgi:hypothetical protein
MKVDLEGSRRKQRAGIGGFFYPFISVWLLPFRLFVAHVHGASLSWWFKPTFSEFHRCQGRLMRLRSQISYSLVFKVISLKLHLPASSTTNPDRPVLSTRISRIILRPSCSTPRINDGTTGKYALATASRYKRKQTRRPGLSNLLPQVHFPGRSSLHGALRLRRSSL